MHIVYTLLTVYAGLCRTCEVFGVSCLVVGSLKVLDDKYFQALSVTAEKWLPVEEVRHCTVCQPLYFACYTAALMCVCVCQ